jgi:CHAT domain
MERMEYIDLVLVVQQGNERDYVVTARSPVREESGVLHFPFDEPALERILPELESALRGSDAGDRSLVPRQEATVTGDFGKVLFAAVFSPPVGSCFEATLAVARHEKKGLRLRLRILDPKLAALPWELLHKPGDKLPLCLSHDTPITRYPVISRPEMPLKVTPPLRILGMIASPSDLKELGAQKEKSRVEEAVADLVEKGLVKLEWVEGQTREHLHEQIMRRGPWHVFHLVGHGSYDAIGGKGKIALAGDDGESESLTASDLAMLLEGHGVQLVLLNACEGARAGQSDIFSSAAANLMQVGIPAVIAMQHRITDVAAIRFASAFYGALAAGSPVEAATTEARRATARAGQNTMEWGTPVLYMRTPDGVLFDLEAPALTALAPAASHDETAGAKEMKAHLPSKQGARNKRTAVIGALVAAAIVVAAVIGLIWRPNVKPWSAPVDTRPARMTAAAQEAVLSGAPTRPPSQVSEASPAPLYRSGVITYVRSEGNAKTLYVLDPDGTSRPLMEDVADLVVISTSPDHRYAAVVYSQKDLSWAMNSLNGRRYVEAKDGIVHLDVLSLDGAQQRNRVLTDVMGGVWAAYAGDERLVVVTAEGGDSAQTFTYYVARPDGSGVRELYHSTSHHGPAPVAPPTVNPTPTGSADQP